MAENKERTFIMVKPDGVQRGLIGKIIQRFEQKGFSLVAMKMLWVSGGFTIFSRLSNDNRYICEYTTWFFEIKILRCFDCTQNRNE